MACMLPWSNLRHSGEGGEGRPGRGATPAPARFSGREDASTLCLPCASQLQRIPQHAVTDTLLPHIWMGLLHPQQMCRGNRQHGGLDPISGKPSLSALVIGWEPQSRLYFFLDAVGREGPFRWWQGPWLHLQNPCRLWNPVGRWYSVIGICRSSQQQPLPPCVVCIVTHTCPWPGEFEMHVRVARARDSRTFGSGLQHCGHPCNGKTPRAGGQ